MLRAQNFSWESEGGEKKKKKEEGLELVCCDCWEPETEDAEEGIAAHVSDP